ncbi:MAG TPA: hypothetical protein VLR54_00815 [Methanobacteriaceae archaeon]|nr:hypothetical protein [Methanobacteriaceae archaeon]
MSFTISGLVIPSSSCCITAATTAKKQNKTQNKSQPIQRSCIMFSVQSYMRPQKFCNQYERGNESMNNTVKETIFLLGDANRSTGNNKKQNQ